MSSVRAIQVWTGVRTISLAVWLLLVMLVLASGVQAQQAEVWVNVSPREAYVFLDGQAIGDGTRLLSAPVGKHVIAVHNYGYMPQSREVLIKEHANDELTFTLVPDGATVSGPVGALQIEGPGRAAVLLNGKTPEYFVGHVDEFNNHIGWSQQLLIPPGTHQLTVTRFGKELWSGPVEIVPNKRVILYTATGKQKVQDWPFAPGALPRFHAGNASATVTVAAVTAEFGATPAQLNCGDSAKLTWSATDAVESAIMDPSGTLKLSGTGGEQMIRPTQSTRYAFHTAGPGGTLDKEVRVDVNPTVQASLTASPAVVKYLQVDKTVLTQQNADLNWSVSNADTVSIAPIGTVEANGSRTVILPIKQTEVGTVDEMQTYTLTASNRCGGSARQTATVNIKGAIGPAFRSVFFPTAYPAKVNPEIGLVRTQQQELSRIADIFKQYAALNPDAKLLVVASSDVRSTKSYNMALSVRRAAIVKNFLVAQGIAEDKIQTQAVGNEKQLDSATVERLDADNPQKDAAKLIKKRDKWLAYNRRADITVVPIELISRQIFPYEVPDAGLVVQSKLPSQRLVAEAQGVAPKVIEAKKAAKRQGSTGK